MRKSKNENIFFNCQILMIETIQHRVLIYINDRLLEKEDHYIDHRIFEMLPLNVPIETPAITAYLYVACLD